MSERIIPGDRVGDLYNQAFRSAECTVNARASEIDPILVSIVLPAARRIGHIMQSEFPTASKAPWVSADIEITNGYIPLPDVASVLQFVESAIWAYQPVWTVYTDGVYMRGGRKINREEIEFTACSEVESIIRWRWNPHMPEPSSDLSKLIAANLKYLPNETARQISYEQQLDERLENILPSVYLEPEDFLIQKQAIESALAHTSLSWEELLTVEDAQDTHYRDMEFIHKKTFPVSVHEPGEIWGILSELSPRERFAILHSLGYIFPDVSTAQVEKNIRMSPGHLRSILHTARQNITELWRSENCIPTRYSTSQIQKMIRESLIQGSEVYRLQNGSVNRSNIRLKLQAAIEAAEGDGLDMLPKRRSRVVRALLEGYTFQEVGDQLGISRKTVVDHAGKALIMLLQQRVG